MPNECVRVPSLNWGREGNLLLDNVYRSTLDRFVEVLNSAQPNCIESVYLGGSMARRECRPPKSDIDVFVIARGTDIQNEVAFLTDLRRMLQENFRPSWQKWILRESPVVLRMDEFRYFCTGAWYYKCKYEWNLLSGEDLVRKALQRVSVRSSNIRFNLFRDLFYFLCKYMTDVSRFDSNYTVDTLKFFLTFCKGRYLARRVEVIEEARRLFPRFEDFLDDLREMWEGITPVSVNIDDLLASRLMLASEIHDILTSRLDLDAALGWTFSGLKEGSASMQASQYWPNELTPAHNLADPTAIYRTTDETYVILRSQNWSRTEDLARAVREVRSRLLDSAMARQRIHVLTGRMFFHSLIVRPDLVFMLMDPRTRVEGHGILKRRVSAPTSLSLMQESTRRCLGYLPAEIRCAFSHLRPGEPREWYQNVSDRCVPRLRTMCRGRMLADRGEFCLSQEAFSRYLSIWKDQRVQDLRDTVGEGAPVAIPTDRILQIDGSIVPLMEDLRLGCASADAQSMYHESCRELIRLLGAA